MVGMISTKKISFEVCFFRTFYLSTPNEGFFFLILISDWVKLNKLSDKDLEKSHLLYIYIYINCENKKVRYTLI